MSPSDDNILVEWNGRLERVREGSKVEVLLTDKELEDCRNGLAIVKDSHGNEVGLTGTLTTGLRLLIFYLPVKSSKKTLDRRKKSM